MTLITINRINNLSKRRMRGSINDMIDCIVLHPLYMTKLVPLERQRKLQYYTILKKMISVTNKENSEKTKREICASSICCRVLHLKWTSSSSFVRFWWLVPYGHRRRAATGQQSQLHPDGISWTDSKEGPYHSHLRH